jgi:hypothetical protein
LTSLKTAAASKKCKDKRKQRKKEQTCKECLRAERFLAQQFLAKAIERGQVATRVEVLDLFARVKRLGGQIDQAFAGQAFLRNAGGPASPANRRRFNAYFECHSKLAGLLFTAIKLWALTCGMKMEDDWVPITIVCMNQQAAKARAKKREPGSAMDSLRALLACDDRGLC